MTFDVVLRSFLAGEGKRFRRKGWGAVIRALDGRLLQEAFLPKWIVKLEGSRFQTIGLWENMIDRDLMADDWEEWEAAE